MPWTEAAVEPVVLIRASPIRSARTGRRRITRGWERLGVVRPTVSSAPRRGTTSPTRRRSGWHRRLATRGNSLLPGWRAVCMAAKSAPTRARFTISIVTPLTRVATHVVDAGRRSVAAGRSIKREARPRTLLSPGMEPADHRGRSIGTTPCRTPIRLLLASERPGPAALHRFAEECRLVPKHTVNRLLIIARHYGSRFRLRFHGYTARRDYRLVRVTGRTVVFLCSSRHRCEIAANCGV